VRTHLLSEVIATSVIQSVCPFTYLNVKNNHRITDKEVIFTLKISFEVEWFISHRTTLKSYPPDTQREPSALKLHEDIEPS
jgi:hypothetical protein